MSKMSTIEISQTDTSYTTKQRRNLIGLSCFTLLLGLPLLLFYGYCWGFWGRGSLLLQYLFQCGCPPTSEEARYPEEVDVIVPACRQSYVELSPSGRYLQVLEETSGQASSYYLLDLQTMGRIDVTNQPFSKLLTDDIGFIENGIEDQLVDRSTGNRYPIKTFRFWRVDAYISGKPNLNLLNTVSHQAKQVFFIQNDDTAVVLLSEFPTNLERNFTFGRVDIPGGDADRVEKFLRENNIGYQTILAGFPDEAVSLDGRFVARSDGIFLAETEQKIVEGYSSSRRWYIPEYFGVKGWIYEGSGVIYKRFQEPCLIPILLPFGDDSGCRVEVPQPVLLLKVPEEYLSPVEAP